MKKWIFLLLACAAYGQNFSIRYTFTNRPGDSTDGVSTIAAPGNAPAYDNRVNACAAWSVAYASSGFTGETFTFQSAADVNGSPGSWSTFAGTTVAGSNPSTATTQSLYTATGFYPFVRVITASLTGTGYLTVTLNCWKSTAYLAGATASPPSGAAGGDLSGTFPNPTVAKVNGNTPGGTCTNQFARVIDSSGRPTCATVANTDLASAVTTVNGTSCTLGSSCSVGTVTAWVGNIGTNVLGTGLTDFVVPWANSLQTVAANAQFIAPATGTLRDLFVSTANTQGAGGSLVFTVNTCTPSAGACTGSASTVVVTIAANATANEFSDVTHTVAVTAGDYISISVTNNHSGNSAQIKEFSLRLVN